MWLERFVIIVTSLHRDFLPSSWGMFYPTVWDWALYVGSIGLFFCLLFLFIRVLPMISVFEMRELVSRTMGRAVTTNGHDVAASAPHLASEPATVEETR
jgi:molybdopterin-containing oxidoreductase family membrane subunit